MWSRSRSRDVLNVSSRTKLSMSRFRLGLEGPTSRSRLGLGYLGLVHMATFSKTKCRNIFNTVVKNRNNTRLWSASKPHNTGNYRTPPPNTTQQARSCVVYYCCYKLTSYFPLLLELEHIFLFNLNLNTLNFHVT